MELLGELGKRGTDVFGMVRKDGKGLSKWVKNVKLNEREKLVTAQNIQVCESNRKINKKFICWHRAILTNMLLLDGEEKIKM